MWLGLVVLAFFALGGLMLVAASREQERVVLVLQAQIDWQREQSVRIADDAARAHHRIDTLENQLRVLKAELGWGDDRHKTRALTRALAALPLPTEDETR